MSNLFAQWEPWIWDVIGIVFLTYHYRKDRFNTLNQAADWFEDQVFVGWLHYRMWGNPVTWLHHTMIAAGVAFIGGLLTWLLRGPFLIGYAHWAIGMAGFYMVRERISWIDRKRKGEPVVPGWRTSWKVDGIMDTVGPILNAVVAVWMVVA